MANDLSVTKATQWTGGSFHGWSVVIAGWSGVVDAELERKLEDRAGLLLADYLPTDEGTEFLLVSLSAEASPDDHEALCDVIMRGIADG